MRFEFKVACLLATDLLRFRMTEHGGVVDSLAMQAGPAGFEDLEIALETLGGGRRTVHAQCRHKQALTKSDSKFGLLLDQGLTAVDSDPVAFASGSRRLALIVESSSPGHASMTGLCDLARAHPTLTTFLRAIDDFGGTVKARWAQCVAASGRSEADVHRLLAALELRAVELDASSSRDSVEMVNRLAELWNPVNHAAGLALANALFEHLTAAGTNAGVVDQASLQAGLTPFVPTTLAAHTRSARLNRLKDAGLERVAMSLRAIGLADDEAKSVALTALEVPSSVAIDSDVTAVVGSMGVGKTMELERLHREAIDESLVRIDAPIPVMLHARELAGQTPQLVVAAAVVGLGDPSGVGVHLLIDGLDEAGLTIDEACVAAGSLIGLWPNSSVVIATRPEIQQPRIPVQFVEPLSLDAAIDLMASIYPDGPSALPRREELTEVLRRPFFAIRYALDLRDGNPAGSQSAQLIRSVGEAALRDVLSASDDLFELVKSVACRIVDGGGVPVELSALGSSQLRVYQLGQLRITEVVDGRLSFQLAAITEWLAASSLLAEPERIQDCLATPLMAYRWRYALAQAVAQASRPVVDELMAALLELAPATAAWVHNEVKPPFGTERTAPAASSSLEAGRRVQNAMECWLQPWPMIRDGYVVNGQMPTIGVHLEGQRLLTAWRRHGLGGPSGDVVELPEGTALFVGGDEWAEEHVGWPQDGESWPWEWTRGAVQREIDRRLSSRDFLAEADVVWAELAWDFAHSVVGSHAQLQSAPIPAAQVSDVVADLRHRFPDGEVEVGTLGRGWRLTEGEAFVEDLVRLGIDEVSSPWAAANAHGGWTWDFWTTDQLLNRLHSATRAALDAYRAVVDRHLPSMGKELNTYQLLPARLVGLLDPGVPGGGLDGAPRFTWHLEPLPAGSPNEAAWSIGVSQELRGATDWDGWKSAVRSRRGEFADHARLTVHHGEPHIYSSTPAGALALSLLASDLKEFCWVSSTRTLDSSTRSVRPRYR